MIELYQFPLSHYCEKARWALDYKKLPYKCRNLLPGLHIKKARKLTNKTSLPILIHDRNIINGSAEIVTYLDQKFFEQSLTPEDPKLKEVALEWEHFADDEIGAYVRLVSYNTLLDHPNIVIPFFAQNGPWYGRFLLKRMFPQLQSRMRKFMNINEQSAQHAIQQLDKALDKIDGHLKDKTFFVGNRFSRADLAVAALLAPFCRPQKYGLDWPDRYPDKLEQVIEHFAPKLTWVTEMYKQYR